MSGYSSIWRGFTHAQIQSIDAGAGFGTLVIGDSTLNGGRGGAGVLCSITLLDPSFSFANGQATMLGAPLTGNITGTGTAAKAELHDSNGVPVISGLTVGVAGCDIDLSTTSFVSGEIVTMNDGTLLLA